MNPAPQHLQSIRQCVDAVLARVGREVVIAAPLGLGKPTLLLNEFYRRALHDTTLKLTIYTALSLRKPAATSELEKRFLEPFVARVFGTCPEFEYVAAVRADRLPDNIKVIEFFLEPGAYLHSASAQQHYLSANYTHAAREILAHANVFTQMVASRVVDGRTEYSLSCNTDITVDLLPQLADLRKGERHMVAIAAVHPQLPFMLGDAEVDADSFDFIVEDPACHYDLYCPPNLPIGSIEHAIGLHASSLVKDGGTLQLGIGELGDAVVSGLLLRQQDNAAYLRALDALGADRGGTIAAPGGNLAPFEMGVYACSEMFIDGFLELYRRGILKRRVYAHAAIQRGLNCGCITEDIDARYFDWLLECGLGPVLDASEFAGLQKAGLFRDGVSYAGGQLQAPDGTRHSANLADPAARAGLLAHCLAPGLRHGVLLHGGFFIGPKAFYAALAEMPDAERSRFDMTGVNYINQLYGPEQELKILQRSDARFINTTMMVTLLGAAVSDGLDNGSVVSGVGGQYNFVAMAHALPGARSILAVRSTHSRAGKTTSNIVWNYGHTTIPRHLRDIVVSEYGVADLRGKVDHEIIAALLNIADSRFQEGLLQQAKAAGKIDRAYRIPDAYRNNTPGALERRLAPFRSEGLFAEFPFGSEFTADEVVLARALRRLQLRTARPAGKALAVLAALWPVAVTERMKPCLARMRLDQPDTLQDKILRNMLAAEIADVLAASGL